MDDIISYLVKMALPALLGAFLWAVTRVWRRKRLSRKNQVAGVYREAAILLFFMFLSGLLALTLTPAGFWEAILSGYAPQLPRPFQGGINLIPIRRSWELLRYYIRNGLWSAVWINFPGNVIMFLPVGFFAALFSDKPRWWKSTLWTAALSLFIEAFQLLISRGTDVDDLILNAFGGLLGYLGFGVFQRLFPDVVSKCVKA